MRTFRNKNARKVMPAGNKLLKNMWNGTFNPVTLHFGQQRLHTFMCAPLSSWLNISGYIRPSTSHSLLYNMTTNSQFSDSFIHCRTPFPVSWANILSRSHSPIPPCHPFKFAVMNSFSLLRGSTESI